MKALLNEIDQTIRLTDNNVGMFRDTIVATLHAARRSIVSMDQRLDALDRPGHPITVLGDRCAICDRPVYEYGDYRGKRYRHELD